MPSKLLQGRPSAVAGTQLAALWIFIFIRLRVIFKKSIQRAASCVPATALVLTKVGACFLGGRGLHFGASGASFGGVWGIILGGLGLHFGTILVSGRVLAPRRDFGSVLGGSWAILKAKMAPTWGPRWLQVGAKMV